MAQGKLKRELTFVSMVSIAAGSVIGGWLAEAPYWFSVSGAGSAFIFPILAILLVPVGLAFAELTAMLPFASAVDVWTTNAFGHKAGWSTQWMMFLVQVVEPPLMAFIFLTAINYFIPIPAGMAKTVAIGLVFLWYVISNFDIKLTGTLANLFFYSMIVMSLFVATVFFMNDSWSMSNITGHGGYFPKGGYGVFIAMAVFSLKFIGFEFTPTLIEETNFPAGKMWIVVMSALFIPAVLYLIVVLAIGGLAPWGEIAGMSMPEPELVAKLGLPAIIGIIAIVSGILHALTTLMGFWASSARVLYGAAQLNQLPKLFMDVNKHGQPWFSNLTVLFFSVFFCMFTETNWVQYIYAVSCIAAGVVYFVCCLNAMKLRKTHPEWERPFKAPGGNPLFISGMVISIWIIIGSVLELEIGGYISLAIYFLIGYGLHLLMTVLRKKYPEKYQMLGTLTPEDKEKFGTL
ncbi:MAG: APC family permease [Synergistaceae bacterium]|jgi:APA family basic amino acid/polyamine antiporter|uniref:APC family permease n=1 Tax=Aminivibrio sp. TaxID=1872489 RepID=UPI0016AEEA0F|nr:APC family permease [Synergistaceae bacterium]NLE90769.1 APC family permease [Dehalococcoidales bacterium]MDD3391420.1 APC family permease [Synergistaceae bacterium]MDD3688952.1 APC family permease [Synergistaceae bacterium]MDD4022117.1 APC family permease [Synergistaceae bacterium]